MSSLELHQLYRSTLLDCLSLACTRVHEARLQMLKAAFFALKLKADPSSLTLVEKAVARVKTEDRRRLRIISALKLRPDTERAT